MIKLISFILISSQLFPCECGRSLRLFSLYLQLQNFKNIIMINNWRLNLSLLKMVAAGRLHRCWGRPAHPAPGHGAPAHPGPGGWGTHDVGCDHVTRVTPGQFAHPDSWCYKPLSPLPRALDTAAVAWVNTWDFLPAHLGMFLKISIFHLLPKTWCQDDMFPRKRIFFLRPLHNIPSPSPGLRWRRLHLQCDQVFVRVRSVSWPRYLQRLLVVSPCHRWVVVSPQDVEG